MSAPISCRCSGANALASATASRAPATSTIANAASPTVGRSTIRRSSVAASASQVASEGETAATRLPSPCSACASMSSAASRSSRSSSVCAERDQQVAGAGEAVDADASPRAGAWPPARTGCRGRPPRRRARPCRCRRRARRSPGRRPCGTRAPRRTAGRCRGSPGRSARPTPGGAHTATSITPAAARGDDAHHDRARVGGAPAGNVDGGRADGHLAQDDALALGQLDGGVARPRPPRRRARRWRSRPAGPAISSSGSRVIASSSSSAGDEQRARLRCRRCRIGACSRAPRRRPRSARAR